MSSSLRASGPCLAASLAIGLMWGCNQSHRRPRTPHRVEDPITVAPPEASPPYPLSDGIRLFAATRDSLSEVDSRVLTDAALELIRRRPHVEAPPDCVATEPLDDAEATIREVRQLLERAGRWSELAEIQAALGNPESPPTCTRRNALAAAIAYTTDTLACRPVFLGNWPDECDLPKASGREVRFSDGVGPSFRAQRECPSLPVVYRPYGRSEHVSMDNDWMFSVRSWRATVGTPPARLSPTSRPRAHLNVDRRLLILEQVRGRWKVRSDEPEPREIQSSGCFEHMPEACPWPPQDAPP